MSDEISILVNGNVMQFAARTVNEALAALKIRQDFFAVAINNEVIPKSRYDEKIIQAGDHIEIVAPTCGG